MSENPDRFSHAMAHFILSLCVSSRILVLIVEFPGHCYYVLNFHLQHVETILPSNVLHQSFVSMAPPPTGLGRDKLFTFQSPGIGPALWGQLDGNNPAFSSTFHLRKSHRGWSRNVKRQAIPRHYGDNQKGIGPAHQGLEKLMGCMVLPHIAVH